MWLRWPGYLRYFVVADFLDYLCLVEYPPYSFKAPTIKVAHVRLDIWTVIYTVMQIPSLRYHTIWDYVAHILSRFLRHLFK